jgi:Type IV pili methyl-accepting chemotaxis transducer N-term
MILVFSSTKYHLNDLGENLMGRVLNATQYKYFLDLNLPLFALIIYLDTYQITIVRKISAALVNISGRQRMLSQKAALFCLKMVCNQNKDEREKLRYQLQEIIDLMQKSHNALITGDSGLNLLGHQNLPQHSYKNFQIQFKSKFCAQVTQIYIFSMRLFIQTQLQTIFNTKPLPKLAIFGIYHI